jgi:DedD protein
MESQTKHRILGILVVIGLVMILLPLFQSNEEETQKTTLVQAPPFPDQSVQTTPLEQVGSVETSQKPLVNNQMESVASNINNEANTTPDPDDGIINTALPNEEAVEPVPFVEEQTQKIASSIEKSAAPIPSTSQPVIAKTEPSQPLVTIKDKEPIKKSIVSKKAIASKPKAIVVKQFNQIYPVSSAKNEVTSKIKPAQLKNSTWVIQVGSYKNKISATQTVNQLRAKGYQAFLQEISTPTGDQTRVFVGPESQRKSAMNLVNKIQKEMQLHGIVITYQPLAL